MTTRAGWSRAGAPGVDTDWTPSRHPVLFVLVTCLVLLLVSCLALAACSRTNITEYIKALGNDQATVCVTNDLSSPWGNDKILGVRTNITNGNVQCNKDGLTVTSTPAAQAIGVQLVPAPAVINLDPFGPGTPPVVRPK